MVAEQGKEGMRFRTCPHRAASSRPPSSSLALLRHLAPLFGSRGRAVGCRGRSSRVCWMDVARGGGRLGGNWIRVTIVGAPNDGIAQFTRLDHAHRTDQTRPLVRADRKSVV